MAYMPYPVLTDPCCQAPENRRLTPIDRHKKWGWVGAPPRDFRPPRNLIFADGATLMTNQSESD
jgi:hypothetical protein